MKKIVIPGEKLEENIQEHVYKENEDKYANIYGMLYKNNDRGKIIPLSSKYIPKEGDKIIAIVESVKYGGCVVDLNSPYDAFLRTDESYKVGDVLSAEVDEVTAVNQINLTNDRKFYGGKIIDINPSRTERVIGKKASMISMIKEKTDSKVFVGRNGRVWLKGGDTQKAEQAIFKIEEEAHTTGLTDRIKNFLEKGD